MSGAARWAWFVGLAIALPAGAGALGACDGAFRFDETPLPGSDARDEAPSSSDDGGRPQCTTDETCGGMRCETTNGRCVACLGDSDCSGNQTHCDMISHVCVECESTLDCGDRQRCDSSTHRCLDACHDDDDPCPLPGFVCDGTLRLCIECRSSANCTGSASGTICDVPIGRCVECTANAQCPAAKPSCDRRTGRCVGCVTYAGCTAGGICDKTTLMCR